MKNSTLTSTLKNIKLWPEAKRLRILELILLLLLIGTAGYAGATHNDVKPVVSTPAVSFGHVTNPTPTPTPAPTPAPVVTPVATPVAPVVVTPATVTPTTTTTTVTGGQGGAETPALQPSGITGVTETQVYNPDTEQNELQPLGGGTFDVTQGGTVVASVTTNEDGTFQLDLDAGDYIIVPTSATPHFFPYLTQSVTVVSEQYTNVTVTYDNDYSHFLPPIKF